MAPKRVRDDSGKFVKSDTAEVEPTADDAINEERQRIADEKTSDFLGEEVKDNKVVADEKPVVEAPKEEPKKEPVVVEEEVDIDKMKSEITDTVRKETAKEITDKLTKALGNKPTEEQKDKYEEYADKFAKEKGRQPAWFELVPFIKDEVKAELKKEQETAQQQTEEQRKKIDEDNKARGKAFNTYIDEQLADLYASGKLPKGDEKARTKLFQTMMEVNNKRVQENKAPIYSIKEIFYEHYTPPTAQPAGADAPISAGRGNAQVDNDQEYSYKDVHNKSFIDVLLGRK